MGQKMKIFKKILDFRDPHVKPHSKTLEYDCYLINGLFWPGLVFIAMDFNGVQNIVEQVANNFRLRKFRVFDTYATFNSAQLPRNNLLLLSFFIQLANNMCHRSKGDEILVWSFFAKQKNWKVLETLSEEPTLFNWLLEINLSSNRNLSLDWYSYALGL